MRAGDRVYEKKEIGYREVVDGRRVLWLVVSLEDAMAVVTGATQSGGRPLLPQVASRRHT